ncbi:MAG TPA: 3'-5' exonuclease, partial [Terrimesophilobacter sp.]|nr:3'-5' exonuclease [Terrimesophilobacter sp.]
MSETWTDSLGVFDLETTGIDVRTSRIVTAHVGVLDASGVLTESTEWLADPGVEIPTQASAVHGITTEKARAEGRPAAQVVAEITAALRRLFDSGRAVVIYNAPYDLSILRHEALRHDTEPLENPRPIIDPLVIDKAVDRYRKGKRTLEFASLHYGVVLQGAHDAQADAVASGRVAQAIAARFTNELPADMQELHDRQVEWAAQQAASFQEYMRR